MSDTVHCLDAGGEQDRSSSDVQMRTGLLLFPLSFENTSVRKFVAKAEVPRNVIAQRVVAVHDGHVADPCHQFGKPKWMPMQ